LDYLYISVSPIFEPCHDKTNIMGLRSAWINPDCASMQSDQDPCCSLSVSLLVIELVSEQHGSLSDCADAQAGLDPCWSQTSVAHLLSNINIMSIIMFCTESMTSLLRTITFILEKFHIVMDWPNVEVNVIIIELPIV
jgi:hypothetical protein